MYTRTKDGSIDDGNGTTIPPANNGTDAWAAYQAWLDAGNTPASYIEPPPAKVYYAKLTIRRACRTLGIEVNLDGLLAGSPSFARDWADAVEIDLSDPQIIAAGAAAGIDIVAVIAKIKEMA